MDFPLLHVTMIFCNEINQRHISLFEQFIEPTAKQNGDMIIVKGCYNFFCFIDFSKENKRDEITNKTQNKTNLQRLARGSARRRGRSHSRWRKWSL